MGDNALLNRIYGDNALMSDMATPRDLRIAAREQALADLAWDKSLDGQLINQAKGFASGVISPLWMIAKPSGPLGHQFSDMMGRWEDNAPHANTLGMFTSGGRGLGRLLDMHPTDLMHLMGVLAPSSPVVRNVQDAITGEGNARRERQMAREYGAAGY